MLAQVQIAAFLSMLVAPAAALSSYMALIPNGDSIGKSLGHTDDGYTDFGTMFSDAGTSWDAVCSETYPGTDKTCGEVLGDPCCTWAKGGTPDFALTAPKTDGTTCASASTPAETTAAPAATAAAPADTPTVTPAPTSASDEDDDEETPAATPAATTASDDEDEDDEDETPAATPAATKTGGNDEEQTIPDTEDTYCT